MIKVSVVTVAYNSEKTIAKTIESVLNQTYLEIEYLIIDGASKDRTVQIAKSYQKQFDDKGYTYRIISEPDCGMYDALNKGVELAQGEIIGQINSDDWYENNALQRVVETYEKEKFDVFWADLRIIKPTGNIIKHAKNSWFASSRYWNHPTTFIRAELYKANPYALISMYDDYDLFLRLRNQNAKIVTLNEVLADFNFGGMSTQKNWKETKNRIRLKCNNFKRNGYGWPYYIDSILIEVAKYLLS